MIKFIDIAIEGFGSILGPFSYTLDNPGINLIKGKNGVGKTTIFSALSWCLYGITLKPGGDVVPWAIIKPKVFKGTKVVVTLKVGLEEVSIVRCKEYQDKIEGSKGNNRIILYINGTYQENLRDKKDVQKKVDSILGMSFNLFKNSLVFGQKLTRLLSEEGKDQKLLFDEAFEATFINNAREKAKKDKEKEAIEYAKVYTEYEANREQYNSLVRSINGTRELWEQQKNEILTEYKHRLEVILKSIKGAKEDKAEYVKLKDRENLILDKMAALDPYHAKHKRLSEREFKIDMELSNLRAEFEALKQARLVVVKRLSSKVRKCPMCEGPIDEAKFKELQDKFKAEKLAIQNKIIRVSERIGKKETRHKKIKSSLLKVERSIKESKELSIELDQIHLYGYENLVYRPGVLAKYQHEREELRVKIANKEKQEPDLKDFYDRKAKVKEKLIAIKPTYVTLKSNIKLLEWLVNEPLSNTGLKAYIFKSMMTQVNERLLGYAKYVGFTINLTMDLESRHKNFEARIYKKKSIVGYHDLSGGQQQLADVCLAFAIHDITAAGRFNLLVMDEVFESLDEDNIELVMDMVQYKSQNTSIHLITHNSSTFAWKIAKEVILESRSGVTNPVS